MTKRVAFLVVLMCVLCCCTTAFATDWFVATNGNDSNAGTIGAPFATFQEAIMDHAQPGDTVQVRAGTYTGLMNVGGDGYCAIQAPDHAVIGGAPGAPITIRPYDGDFTAIFTGCVSLVRCKYINITGLDMSIPTGGHPFRVISGCDDYFTPEKRSNHINVTNCKIHDGGTSSGQLKIQQSDSVTIENCEMYNLGAGGAVIDCVYVNNCVFKKNYIHEPIASHGFVKGGSLYNTFEDNVATGPANPNTIIWGFMPGGQTGTSFCPPDVYYESMYTVIRNNIVTGATRGALPSEESAYCYAYNNLWYDCAGYNSGYSYCTQINTGAPRWDDYTRHFYVFNNIFWDPQGDMRAYGWAQGGSGNQEDWQSGYNNYWNQGNPITVDTSGFIDPNTETGRQIGDPHLTMSGGTPTTRQGWIDYFRPSWDAQSNAMLKDKGTSNAGNAPCPGVIRDIEGHGRPCDGGWDIGPYEYQGAPVTPTAEFSSDRSWATIGSPITFTDYSLGGPTAWSWSFGDSQTATVQNPAHSYTSNGQKTVSLTATNGAGNDSETKTNYITIKPLDAAFKANVTAGNVTQVVNFTDQSTDSPTAWSWTFGDSQTATVQNPSHTYTAVGTYTVVLVATNANGSDTETKTNYISISAFQADFTASPTWGMPPLAVTFADASKNNATSWSWTFGDGGSSTLQSPSHTFSTTGYYNVSLSSSNAYGSDSETKSSFITVCNSSVYVYPTSYTMPVPDPGGNQHLVSGTLADVQTGSGNGMVFACDTATQHNGYNILDVRWNANTGYLPSQIAGIKLDYQLMTPTYTDICGGLCPWANTRFPNGACRLQYIPNAFGTVYSFTQSRAELVGNNLLDASGNVTANMCNMPYTNKLEVYTIAWNLVRWTVYLNPGGSPAPVADFSGTPTSGNAPLAVSFTDSSTNTPTAWSWNFGDSSTSTVQNPSHSYAAGTYTVSLTATNAGGSDGETKTNYITVNGSAPVANFSGTPTTGYLPLIVQFTDSSTNAPTAWSWNFGDTNAPYNTSTEQNPQKWYTQLGTFTVSLTATNAYGNDTMTRTNYCTSSLAPTAPTPNFTATPLSGSSPLTVQFTDSSVGGACWDWRFGDGNGSNDQNPSHVYTTPGTYTVTLYLRGTSGYCAPLVKTNYITVSGAPVANFTGTPTTGYLPLIVNFTDSSTNNPTSWSWNFGDTNVPYNTSTLQNPTKWYVDAGTFTVSLTATNAYGNDTMTRTNYCTSSVAPTAPTVDFSATPTSGTSPLTVQFTNSSVGGSCYDWQFGDGTGSSDQNPSHTYTSPGVYTVKLRVKAGYCNSLTKTNYITVNAPLAMPTYVAAGTVASGTGTISPALPSGRQTNDILLLFVETANQASSITNQNGGTWTQVTNSPQSVGTAGGSNGTRLTVFWSRYNGTQGAPTTSDSGNHQLGRIIAIRGATTSGDPCNITAGNTEATVDTSGAIAGATTTVANTLVVAAIATSLPDASGTASFSAWTNADLSSLTERTDNTVTAGNGGGLGIATGGKATAGAYTTTAVTCGTATTKAMLSIAIKP